MNIDDVRLKTVESKLILEQARRYAKEAENEAEPSKRDWLQNEVKKLFEQARELTEKAREQASKYSKRLG